MQRVNGGYFFSWDEIVDPDDLQPDTDYIVRIRVDGDHAQVSVTEGTWTKGKHCHLPDAQRDDSRRTTVEHDIPGS